MINTDVIMTMREKRRIENKVKNMRYISVCRREHHRICEILRDLEGLDYDMFISTYNDFDLTLEGAMYYRKLLVDRILELQCQIKEYERLLFGNVEDKRVYNK